MSKSILVITGDGGECYETLYAVHRFREPGYRAANRRPVTQALTISWMHDFEPGWDTYCRTPGYQLAPPLRRGPRRRLRSRSSSAAARPSTCGIDRRVIDIVR